MKNQALRTCQITCDTKGRCCQQRGCDRGSFTNIRVTAWRESGLSSLTWQPAAVSLNEITSSLVISFHTQTPQNGAHTQDYELTPEIRYLTVWTLLSLLHLPFPVIPTQFLKSPLSSHSLLQSSHSLTVPRPPNNLQYDTPSVLHSSIPPPHPNN